MTVEEARMLDEIEELLRAPAIGSAAPTLAHLEEKLTDGYAAALALEAERARIERRLGEVARALPESQGATLTEELGSLARRLTSADGELVHLRRRLRSLRERARSAALAAAS